MYDKYSGDKTIIKFEGDHNTERPFEFNMAAANFLA